MLRLPIRRCDLLLLHKVCVDQKPMDALLSHGAEQSRRLRLRIRPAPGNGRGHLCGCISCVSSRSVCRIENLVSVIPASRYLHLTVRGSGLGLRIASPDQLHAHRQGGGLDLLQQTLLAAVDPENAAAAKREEEQCRSDMPTKHVGGPHTAEHKNEKNQ